MDNKFSINHIAEMLSEKTGGTPADAEQFLKELISIINEGIIKDQVVNIAGFGTFKVVLVKERDSVSVNTGERIVIPPHHKLSFMPEKEIKELINKPFAAFEAIEVQENESGVMNFTIPAEIGEGRGKDESKVEENEISLAEKQPPAIIGSEASVEKQVDEEAKDEVLSENTVYQEPPMPLANKEVSHRTQAESAATPPPPSHHAKKVKRRKRKSKKISTRTLWTILFILLFIFLAGGIWQIFFHTNSFDNFISWELNARIPDENALILPADSVASDQLTEADTAALDTIADALPEIDRTDTLKPEIAEPPAAPASEPPVSTAVPPAAPRPVAAAPQANTASTRNNVLARVTMQPGQRLTVIAEQYYGLKIFWVYIYEYNKARIGMNPDRIPTGMEILVPAKEVYGIDANSAYSIEQATDLQTLIMTRY